MLNVFPGCLCDGCSASDTAGNERFGRVVPRYDTTILSGFELLCGSVISGGEKYRGVDLTNVLCSLSRTTRFLSPHFSALLTVVVTHVVAAVLGGNIEISHILLRSGYICSRGTAMVTAGSGAVGFYIAG